MEGRRGGSSSGSYSQIPVRTGMGSVNSPAVSVRLEAYDIGEKKCISDVRRTFCLFVTFDLLFITMLWIIELNNGAPAVKQIRAGPPRA